MEMYEQFHAALTLAPWKRASHSNFIRGWLSPRAILNMVAKRKHIIWKLEPI